MRRVAVCFGSTASILGEIHEVAGKREPFRGESLERVERGQPEPPGEIERRLAAQDAVRVGVGQEASHTSVFPYMYPAFDRSSEIV